MDYAKLTAELTDDPLGRGYAGMTDAEAEASLNTADREVQTTVPAGVLHQAMDNLVDANSVPVWEALDAHRTAETNAGAAVRAAYRLRDAIAGYPAVNVHSPLFSGQLAILVSAEILTQAQADSLVAL